VLSKLSRQEKKLREDGVATGPGTMRGVVSAEQVESGFPFAKYELVPV
jgi:hypothetical protein